MSLSFSRINQLGAYGAAPLLFSLLTACSGDDAGNDEGGGGAPGAEESSWELVELEDTVCADGSQYKFFVKRVEGAENLALTLEPGGACWNYATCSGENGVLRVANLDGLGDEHMTALPPPLGTVEGGVPWGLMFPHLGDSDRGVITADYNQVYFPYCTGDAFLGDLVKTYESDDGKEKLKIRHRGAHNLRVAEEWLKEEFEDVFHLLISGASAGALGATVNYSYLRDAVKPEWASLINDSGPLFAPGGPQTKARAAFEQRWETSALLQELDERLDAPEETRLVDDSGNINVLLSKAFPNDRFLVTYFMRDLNYSLFSYEGFFDDLSTKKVYGLWEEDSDLLLQQINELKNWGYYLPGFRADGCSHVVTIVPINELSDPSYIRDALDGEVHGYLRTELEDMDFADALASTITRGDEMIRELEIEPKADFTEEEEDACRLWPE